MRRRHPKPAPALPRIWLMTDERMGNALWDAIDALPRGGGIVLRHHATPDAERRVLIDRIARIARRRRLVLLIAGDRPGRCAGDGVHNARRTHARQLMSRSVHSRREFVTAMRDGADLAFVSPVFATRSHPNGAPLGVVRTGLLIRGAKTPVIALGGLNPRGFARLRGLGIYGWAGIDALIWSGRLG